MFDKILGEVYECISYSPLLVGVEEVGTGVENLQYKANTIDGDDQSAVWMDKG